MVKKKNSDLCHKCGEVIKPVDFELATWECVNYILVGLAKDLDQLGAKPDFKLKLFQLWAEYLRRNEVAFNNDSCNSSSGSQADLTTRKRKRSKEDENSSIEPTNTKRPSNDLSAESKNLSTVQSSSVFQSYENSAGSSLCFKDLGVKYFNENRPRLKSHFADDYCKCFPKKKVKEGFSKKMQEFFNRRILHSLLYIALNLIDDDIQLFDLVRFIKDGHLSSKKESFDKFFPADIKSYCQEILSGFDFPKDTDSIGVRIRKQAYKICRFLSIKSVNTPNLHRMAMRFCKDFMLPREIITYIERLMNFSTPQMKFMCGSTPFYEGRMMAFILFILKLIFGMDGVTEVLISDSAKNVNKILQKQNRTLFVWTEWMNYIESRKVILSRYNLCNSEINENLIDHQYFFDKYENKHLDDCEPNAFNRKNVHSLNYIFEDFSKDYLREEIAFEKNATFTPQIDYFNKILENPPEDLKVLDYLKFDYSFTEIKPFITPMEIKRILKQDKIDMIVIQLKGNENISLINTFGIQNRKPYEHFGSLRKVKYADSRIEQKNGKKDQSFEEYSKIFESDFLKIPRSSNDLKAESKKINSKHLKVPNKLTTENELYLYKHKYNALLNKELPVEVDSFCNNSSSDEFEDNSSYSSDRDSESNQIEFTVFDMNYWILHGNTWHTKENDLKDIQSDLPKSFFWLLETFAEYLNCNWRLLYKELMILENQYFYILEDVDKIKNIMAFKTPNLKDSKQLYAEYFNRLW